MKKLLPFAILFILSPLMGNLSAEGESATHRIWDAEFRYTVEGETFTLPGRIVLPKTLRLTQKSSPEITTLDAEEVAGFLLSLTNITTIIRIDGSRIAADGRTFRIPASQIPRRDTPPALGLTHVTAVVLTGKGPETNIPLPSFIQSAETNPSDRLAGPDRAPPSSTPGGRFFSIQPFYSLTSTGSEQISTIVDKREMIIDEYDDQYTRHSAGGTASLFYETTKSPLPLRFRLTHLPTSSLSMNWNEFRSGSVYDYASRTPDDSKPEDTAFIYHSTRSSGGRTISLNWLHTFESLYIRVSPQLHYYSSSGESRYASFYTNKPIELSYRARTEITSSQENDPHLSLSAGAGFHIPFGRIGLSFTTTPYYNAYMKSKGTREIEVVFAGPASLESYPIDDTVTNIISGSAFSCSWNQIIPLNLSRSVFLTLSPRYSRNKDLVENISDISNADTSINHDAGVDIGFSFHPSWSVSSGYSWSSYKSTDPSREYRETEHTVRILTLEYAPGERLTVSAGGTYSWYASVYESETYQENSSGQSWSIFCSLRFFF